MSEFTLLLIDALAFAYRAFHAIPGLATRAGQPTNAVFGFLKMQRQLSERWKPTHMAVVFDGGLPEDRMKALPAYKAQRPPMPEALAAQLPLIEEYLAASRIPAIRIAGEEADDVMASLAAQAAGRGARVLLGTSDKDLYQIVGERVVMVSPVKAGEAMGPREVELKTGVPPERIRDWLALTGDDSDNIPGVPGIGGKTAAKLLAEFGSVENLLASAERIAQPRLRDALLQHRDVVLNNLRVLALRMDVDPGVRVEDLEVRAGDAGRLAELFDRLEFRSLAQQERDAASRLF